MATYVVGDIQGCFEPLSRLLELVDFDAETDQLWAVGDLVNRGPQSLETLRFLSSLGAAFCGVLGNHDLHVLAVAAGVRKPGKKDTLEAVLSAPDRDQLLDWLRHLPILSHRHGHLLVHAGIDPRWDLNEAQEKAGELESALRSANWRERLGQLFGNEPRRYDETLSPKKRLRTLVNVFTRMRFCDPEGRLDFECKLGMSSPPRGMKAWFQHKRALSGYPILFGHWAALDGVTGQSDAISLDTGCVWGRRLTALHLENGRRYSVQSSTAAWNGEGSSDV